MVVVGIVVPSHWGTAGQGQEEASAVLGRFAV